MTSQVRDLEAQANRYRDEASALRRMTLELEARAPNEKRLIEAVVAREQAVQVGRA